MQALEAVWKTVALAGWVGVPLLVLALVATVILLDKAYLYWRHVRLPRSARADLEAGVGARLGPAHVYGAFFATLQAHREEPDWWLEAQAQQSASRAEAWLSRGMWLLETIVTAAPLLGLLGTITGMMQAFRLIGADGPIEAAGVSGGVAESLVATAMGLVVALIAVFGYNYFSGLQSRTLDELERLGTQWLARRRLDRRTHEAA